MRGIPEKTECGNCRFWERVGGAEGLCRRESPQGLVVEDGEGRWGVEWRWPLTLGEDWCGEWKPGEPR